MRRSVSNSPNTKLELERALQAKRVAQVLAESEISASNASENDFFVNDGHDRIKIPHVRMLGSDVRKHVEKIWPVFRKKNKNTSRTVKVHY